MRLAIFGLDNPLTAGVRTLSVSTSSNSGGSASYRIIKGSSVGTVAFSVSNPAAGAAGVTYGATFALPASGALVAGFGAIDIAAAPGTFALSGSCSSDGATVTDLTTQGNRQCELMLGVARTRQGLFETGNPRPAKRR